MQFLKILFWCLLAFLAAAFTIGNWNAVPIRLPGGLVADVNLPFLLLCTFLLGFAPTLGWQAAKRWRLKQRITMCERELAEVRTYVPAFHPAAPLPMSPSPVAPPAPPKITLAPPLP